MLAPVFAEAVIDGWSTKELLIAIGSTLAVIIPIAWGIIEYLGRSYRLQIRELRQNVQDQHKVRDQITSFQINLDNAQAKISQLESERNSLLAKLADYENSVTSLKIQLTTFQEELQQTKEKLQSTQKELNEEQNRIKNALKKDGQSWNVRVLSSAPTFKPLDPEGRRTPILSILNLKGGVGKTTISANLAAAFDHLGYRVLLVDLDLQASLTSLFLTEQEHSEYIKDKLLLEDFLMASFESEYPNIHEYIRPILPDQKSGLLATSDTLGYTETTMAVRWRLRDTTKDARFLLRKHLHQVNTTKEYNLILLDCPPLINVCCVNAVAASDYLLIPTMPSRNSTWRVPVLLRRINEFVENINPTLKVLGVIPNRTFGAELTSDETNLLTAMTDQCLNEWGQHVQILSPHIPRNVCFRQSEEEKRTLLPTDPIFNRFVQLAHQIEDRMPMFCRLQAPTQPKMNKEPVG
ncbi:MAG: AAA family ATPase [Gemmataceae bacterium]